MGTTAFVLAEDFEEDGFGTVRAAFARPSRLRALRPDDRGPGAPTNVEPPVLTPGRASLARWLTAGRWFDFSRGGDLPASWPTGAIDTRCDNCGASASSQCSMACPDRLLTSTGEQRLAVQVPCGLHEGGESTSGEIECPHCVDGHVTVAWATNEFGPLQVVDYRYRLRRSKPAQFKLSDGSYHDATGDIEPICLPGRWARGGSIEAIS